MNDKRSRCKLSDINQLIDMTAIEYFTDLFRQFNCTIQIQEYEQFRNWSTWVIHLSFVFRSAINIFCVKIIPLVSLKYKQTMKKNNQKNSLYNLNTANTNRWRSSAWYFMQSFS